MNETRFHCPRCGAQPNEACELIGNHAHATILRPHPERGMRPWQLVQAGYLQYVLVDVDGFKLHLWRLPTQRPVTWDGWRIEGDET